MVASLLTARVVPLQHLCPLPGLSDTGHDLGLPCFLGCLNCRRTKGLNQHGQFCGREVYKTMTLSVFSGRFCGFFSDNVFLCSCRSDVSCYLVMSGKSYACNFYGLWIPLASASGRSPTKMRLRFGGGAFHLQEPVSWTEAVRS